MRRRACLAACMVAWALLTVPACGPKPPKKKPQGEEAQSPAGPGQFASDPDGSLTGTLARSLNRGVIGEYTYRTDKDPSKTRSSYDWYKAEQGVRLQLVNASATPAAVGPNQQVLLDVTYALLGPDDQQKTRITETRRVTLGGRKVAELRASVVRGVGTYTSRVPITLPATAARGRYDVLVTVSAGGAPQSSSSSFTVN